MSEITVRFAILTKQLDAEGFLYCKDMRIMSGLEEADELLHGKFADLLGGYIFIVDHHTWNSYDQALFNPGHVRCAIDSLVFSALLLDQIAAQIDERPTLSATLTEMTSLQIEFISTDDVTITGVNDDGYVIYPTTTIKFTHLLQGLVAATEDFLRISQETLDRRAASPATDHQANQEQVNRAFLNEWRNTVERLRHHGT